MICRTGRTGISAMNKMFLYESRKLRSVTGPAIRPGGFALTDKGLSLCRLPSGSFVLDAGCGSGATVEYLNSKHGLKAFGLDLSVPLLADARESAPDLPFIRGDAAFVPCRANAFSAVFCECVLSLASDRGQVLSEFLRVLRPGGYLIVTDIYLPNGRECDPFHSISAHCCLKGADSKDTICQAVSDEGFALLAWEDHSNLLKILAAQLVFAYGSMRRFWSSFCTETESEGIAAGAKKFRPGYYFLAARKEVRI